MLLQMSILYSFLWQSKIPVYTYAISSLSQLSVNGHLDCSHVLAIVDSAAMDGGLRVSFQITVFIFSGYAPEWDCWIIFVQSLSRV